jgi:hypothetical protein
VDPAVVADRSRRAAFWFITRAERPDEWRNGEHVHSRYAIARYTTDDQSAHFCRMASKGGRSATLAWLAIHPALIGVDVDLEG